MDFEFTEDQEMLRDTVRRFLADRAPASYVRAMLDDPRGTSDEVWGGLAELGLTGILVAEEHGGAGMGMVDMGVVLEEMGRAAHPGPFLSSAVAAVSAVTAVGSPVDHADLLPGLADGSRVATVALHEPGGRYEWRSPSTKAADAGDGWIVEGTKANVPDAGAADLLIVTAATEDGLGLFAVEVEGNAVTVTDTPSLEATRRAGTVELAGARARRIGAGDATEALAGVVDRITVAWVVDGVGAADEALRISLEYAKEREQFGRPIGSFQAIQHLCADMLHDVEMARAGAYYALWACDAAPAEERHRAATMAKAFASDALAHVGASTIQVLGGIGFTWEHDAHLYFKRLLALQQTLGTSSDHLEELARIALA